MLRRLGAGRPVAARLTGASAGDRCGEREPGGGGGGGRDRILHAAGGSGKSLTLSVSPRTDTIDPRRFTSTGRLARPEGVTAKQGCSEGVVSVQIKAGRRTLST